MKRDLVCLSDLGAGGIGRILEDSARFERIRGQADHPRPLSGLSAALVFDKASTRTRVSLQVAVFELGGHPIVLSPDGSQIGRGEPLEDTARVLSRYVHVITYRTFSTERIAAMARAARVPVVNALSDEGHPLQILADLHTVRKARGSVEKLRYAWIGDGNNMARSWIEAAGLLGLELRLAVPEGYEPPAAEVERANQQGGRVLVCRDPQEAASGADVINTDVWASMGQEADAEKRRRAFVGYRVSRDLLRHAARGAIVLHCLPAHRGEEIDADVIDGPESLVWDQAEARLHTAKAVLAWAVAGAGPAGA
jgi:ornithine carbamoyltransferase